MLFLSLLKTNQLVLGEFTKVWGHPNMKNLRKGKSILICFEINFLAHVSKIYYYSCAIGNNSFDKVTFGIGRPYLFIDW